MLITELFNGKSFKHFSFCWVVFFSFIVCKKELSGDFAAKDS